MPTSPKITIPNIDAITKKDVKVGEALQQIAQYVNANTSPAAGNKVNAPSFVSPGRPPG